MKTTTIAIAALSLSNFIHAEEGGAGHYVPGTMATLIDLPPTKAGWAFETAYLHYEGDASASRPLPIAGLIAGDLEASSDAFLLGGFYTFENKVAGAWYSVGAFVPWVWMDATADISAGPISTEIHSSENGLGDIALMPLLMGWKCDELQYSAALPIYVPSGDYEEGRLANPGRNHWTFDPTVGISYSGAKTLLNASFITGFAINTENGDTDYKSGTVWHSELSVQQLFPAGPGLMGIGFNAFYYDQISGDTGAGAKFGDFKGRTTGIGPAITYVLPQGDKTFVGELRWLPELDTKRRLEGDYVWLKLVCQF